MDDIKPDDVWINGINLSGLWFKKPRKAVWDYELECWYDKSGNFSVTRIGLDDKASGLTTFASHDKESVETWTSGAKSALQKINIWSKV